MGDYSSVQSLTENFKKPKSSSSSSSYLFTSPRLFTGFSSKGLTDSESVMSPTSILDNKPFSAVKNTLWSETLAPPKSPKPENRSHLSKLDSIGVGLSIANSLSDEISDSSKPTKPESRKVLFGSQLKIQIPSLPPSVFSGSESPKSPADFGIKTRNSQPGSFSPCLSKKSPIGSSNSRVVENGNPNSPRVFTGCLSASEMELSEDYTCVISYGPNPKTTHIFDDCIVESCCGVVGFSGSKNGNGLSVNPSMSYPSESFLSFCYSCKKNLGHGKDIYMYRGEKAFCSSECRYKEMMLDEGIEKLEPKDAYGTFP